MWLNYFFFRSDANRLRLYSIAPVWNTLTAMRMTTAELASKMPMTIRVSTNGRLPTAFLVKAGIGEVSGKKVINCTNGESGLDKNRLKA